MSGRFDGVCADAPIGGPARRPRAGGFAPPHPITSSARISTVVGTMRPSALQQIDVGSVIPRLTENVVVAFGSWRSATETFYFGDPLASDHQTVGKAEPPYSGNRAGRPKRSQRAARTLSSVNCGTT